MNISTAELKRALLVERESSFFRLRGGYPIPLAGAIWWACLGFAGFHLRHHDQWIMLAFVTSGLIFPLALLLARVTGNGFMQDRTAVSDALFPAFASMLVFWPIAISAFWSYPELVPLILGIGMSVHWPVIGWMYGRTAIYTTHSVVRAIACFVVWNRFPEGRFTVLPFSVSGVYLLTVAAIVVASSDVYKARWMKASALAA